MRPAFGFRPLWRPTTAGGSCPLKRTTMLNVQTFLASHPRIKTYGPHEQIEQLRLSKVIKSMVSWFANTAMCDVSFADTTVEGNHAKDSSGEGSEDARPTRPPFCPPAHSSQHNRRPHRQTPARWRGIAVNGSSIIFDAEATLARTRDPVLPTPTRYGTAGMIMSPTGMIHGPSGSNTDEEVNSTRSTVDPSLDLASTKASSLSPCVDLSRMYSGGAPSHRRSSGGWLCWASMRTGRCWRLWRHSGAVNAEGSVD
ncbi:hypothetical protein V8D89_000281 [Ganoderma adspersum]